MSSLSTRNSTNLTKKARLQRIKFLDEQQMNQRSQYKEKLKKMKDPNRQSLLAV